MVYILHFRFDDSDCPSIYILHFEIWTVFDFYIYILHIQVWARTTTFIIYIGGWGKRSTNFVYILALSKLLPISKSGLRACDFVSRLSKVRPILKSDPAYRVQTPRFQNPPI